MTDSMSANEVALYNEESGAPGIAWHARRHPKTKTLKLVETSHFERILAKQSITVQPSEITARALIKVVTATLQVNVTIQAKNIVQQKIVERNPEICARRDLVKNQFCAHGRLIDYAVVKTAAGGSPTAAGK